MALNTTNLFTTVGKAVKVYHYLRATVRPQIETYLEAFRTSCDANSFTGQDEAINDYISSANATLEGLALQLKDLTDAIFLHPVVTNELVLTPDFDIEEVYQKVAETTGYTLQQNNYLSVIDAGDAVNHGTDTDLFEVICTTTLDGINPAIEGALPLVSTVWGPTKTDMDDTQYGFDEDKIRVTCVVDTEQGGASAGNEQFQVSGKPGGNRFSNNIGGCGTGPVLNINNSDNDQFVVNGGFEDWTTGVPDGWTVTGSALTEDSTGSIRGAKHLQLDAGDASLVTQTIDRTLFSYFQAYALHFWYKANIISTTPSAIIVNVKAGATTIKTATISTSTVDITSWTSIGNACIFRIPEDLAGQDITIELDMDGSGVEGAEWEIDEVTITPLTYHGGFGWAVVSGSNADTIIVNDRRGYDVDFGEFGYFNSYFVETSGVHFPNEPTAGTPSIADSLATP
jgi:hypothetical protein